MESVSEIADLDFALVVDEDVIALEIPMDLPPAVDAPQAFQDLIHQVPDDSLGYFLPLIKAMLDEPRERPTIHILHEHEQTVLV